VFASGHIVELILLLVAVEALVLWFFARRTGRVVTPLMITLAAGACLLLALRAALDQSGALWIGFFLGAALVAHLSDLAVRLRAR
jgi:hypothetical protein